MNRSLKILIADDTEEKINAIEEVLLNSNFLISNIEYSHSYNSTTKKLKINNFDLLILDMSMPTFDPSPNRKKSSPRALAGKDIMTKMKYRGIDIPVIIITQFDVFGRHSDAVGLDDLVDDLSLMFPNIFMGHIYYNPQSIAWSNELINMVTVIFNE